MQTHGGVSRCFAEIYSNLNANPDLDAHVSISVNETDNVYLRELGIGSPRGFYYKNFIVPFHFPFKGRVFSLYNHYRFGFPYQSRNEIYFHEQEYLKQESIKALKKGDFDVFHPTFFDDYFLPYLNGKPFVLTIHDMISELYPQYFNLRLDKQIVGKRKLAPLASAIITVSENTKRDVVRILGVPEDKIQVVYHGSEHIRIPKEFRVPKSFPSEIFSHYILYVGDRYGYKNFDLFVVSVSTVLKHHSELKVICTGKDFNDKELTLMSHLGVKDLFISHWVQTDEEFFYLYHNAICLVYTSEYEGFGIPILEAYKADCPVMLNNASCFPEIAGNAAVYFNLTNSESNFADQFEKIYCWTEKEREEFLNKQRKRLSLYSWKKSAIQISEIYKSVIKSL